jgi:acetyl-CoA hydrolase
MLERQLHAGAGTYVPIFLSDIPKLFRSGHMPLDVVLLYVSPPDEHGFCSLGTSVDCTLAAAQAASLRIAQINPNMPRTLGDSFIHIRELDYTVDVDEPLPEFESGPPDDIQMAIGRLIADLTPDGATLQLGIGEIPNAVLSALARHKDLGIHSEVVSDGIVDLFECGVINGSKKKLNNGKIVVSFLNGTKRLYDFADNNPLVEMRQVDYTNNTLNILRLDNMIAINSAIEIDLTGQVCAESMGSKIYSGVGGQMDFMRGASLSQCGKPIIALAATAKRGTISRIVPQLQAGAGVTTTRAHMHYVVTEYGQVDLHGLDLEERARAMIGLAHPKFREDLERSARELALIA